MLDYAFKFILGGTILVLATYFGKSKDLFLAGIITTIPLMTLANMVVQMKLLDPGEFRQAQTAGILGGLGLTLFVAAVYVLTRWFKPSLSVGLAVLIYVGYFTLCRRWT